MRLPAEQRDEVEATSVQTMHAADEAAGDTAQGSAEPGSRELIAEPPAPEIETPARAQSVA
jgi:hypothetical protein